MSEPCSTRSVKFGQNESNLVTDCDPIEIQTLTGISMTKKKTSKGSVVVRSTKNRLRLVWTFCGKRYFFALELPDTKANRAIAEMQAKQIERDIINDLFDPTLETYRAAYQGHSGVLAATEGNRSLPQGGRTSGRSPQPFSHGGM